MGVDDLADGPNFAWLRYLAPPRLPNLVVGMRRDGADPPLWARWHRHTPDFDLVERRLIDAGYFVQHDQRHLWLPLELAPDAGFATAQIASLVSHVVQSYEAAVGRQDARPPMQ